MDAQLAHIESDIEATCKAVSYEINADCRASNFRKRGTVIDLEFVIGEKYGQRDWVMEVMEPQPVWNFASDDPPPMTTDYKTVRYQSVRVVGPVHHPIAADFWQSLAGDLVSEFLKHQPD